LKLYVVACVYFLRDARDDGSGRAPLNAEHDEFANDLSR
jgi:hypothetical protein